MLLMFRDVIHSIVVDKARSVLVVDRHPENSDDHVHELSKQLRLIGFDVGINTQIKSAHDLNVMVRQKSILSIMKNKRDATILVMDATSKKLVLPQKLSVGESRILILYIQTHLQKLPYAKKYFDAVHMVSGSDATNTYVTMVSKMVMDGIDDCDLEDMSQHDITMMNLILMQNIHASKPSLCQCIHTYKNLVASEVFANNVDDSVGMANIIQGASLLALMRGSPPPPDTKFHFTQHLSRYSVLGGTKRKQIDSSVDLKIPGMTYGDVLLHTDVLGPLCSAFQSKLTCKKLS